MRKIFFISFYLFLSFVSVAQSPTWNQDIAQIFFTNCTSCHNENGVAHFPLTTYASAKDMDNEILDAIETKQMPPWPPDETYVHFKDERTLTEEERNLIIDWVLADAPLGSGEEPEAPIYASGASLADIDLEIMAPEYSISMNTDEYRTFVIHSETITTKYISAIEYLPGNTNAVHHILLFQDTSNLSWLNDEMDPLPGYASNGAMLPSEHTKLIGGWAPGGNINYLPYGMGIELPAGTDLVMEVHYAPGHIGETDASIVNLKYSETPFTRPVWVDPILYHFWPCFQEPLFYIPANTTQTFHEIFDENYDLDLTLISVSPHMHLLGETFLAYGITPSEDTIPMIHIDKWDFHWQGAYQFQKLLKIPKNTNFYGTATYDNTTANENNPNDPPEDVWLGEQTTDEMMLCFFAYTFYVPGDENIVLDSSILNSTQNIEPIINTDIFPNPTSSQFNIRVYDPSISNYSVIVTDIYGRKIFEENYEAAQNTILTNDWNDGIYFVEISSGRKRTTYSLMKFSE